MLRRDDVKRADLQFQEVVLHETLLDDKVFLHP